MPCICIGYCRSGATAWRTTGPTSTRHLTPVGVLWTLLAWECRLAVSTSRLTLPTSSIKQEG
jgi:hypothetical protein